jgi:hypothetical protein
MSKPLSELPPETVERWRKRYMPPFADRPDLKHVDNAFREAQRIREEALTKVEEAKGEAETILQRHLMKRMHPHMLPTEKLYECPKCHQKWRQSELNYSIKGRGKHKKKVAWCPHCNLQIFPEGDEALKHPIIPVRDKMLKVTFVNNNSEEEK